ncbi:hypothetical protein HT031_000105 [Scenedesmus sp. PABB004]|nr:hypothetical protein HT031_000105 [Scenedesmus sp. PABB004]
MLLRAAAAGAAARAGRAPARALPALASLPAHARALSTQHEEELAARRAGADRGGGGAPPILPAGGAGSQTSSRALAGEGVRGLVYEARGLEEQRGLIATLYDEHATFENNVSLVSGRAEIAKRFALLPIAATRVAVAYKAPVVLGATASGPEALDNLATKGDLQVEVLNTQSYTFDRAHSLWRALVLPSRELELLVLTRLTLTRDGSKARARALRGWAAAARAPAGRA